MISKLKNRAFCSLLTITFCLMPLPLKGDMVPVKLKGFGTLAYNRLLFTSSETGSPGSRAGYSYNGNTTRDTKIGLNVSADFSESLNATLQFVGRSSSPIFSEEKAASLDVELALINYKATSWMTLQAGRRYLPSWLTSEESAVGYSYPWVRPPAEVYIMSGGLVIDGINADIKVPLDEVTVGGYLNLGISNPSRQNTTQKGRTDNLIGTIKVTELDGSNRVIGTGLNLSVANTFTQATFGYSGGDVNFSTKFDSRATAMNPLTVEVKLTGKNKLDAFFYTVGHRARLGDFLLMAEWAILEAKFSKPEGSGASTNRTTKYLGWYSTVGYKLSCVTPLITYANNRTDTKFKNPLERDDHIKQESLTGGLNVDIGGNIVLKTEVQYIQDQGSTSFGMFGIPAKSRLFIGSTSLDFVF